MSIAPWRLRLNMSKAYDRIKGTLLNAVLRRMGFHATWISWIMSCVTSVSYSFLISDGPQGRVLTSGGLCQGDSLSPYLFICTEVLSGMCGKSQAEGLILGIKVAHNCPPINHLLFADDTIFFTTNQILKAVRISYLCLQNMKRHPDSVSTQASLPSHSPLRLLHSLRKELNSPSP